jgi:diguanylate cyclase (GGDEF)-like protein/PAS domain S-box-containing protein
MVLDYLTPIDNLKSGDHLCFLYETDEEHRAVISSFISQGVKRGEKVIYIRDTYPQRTIVSYLREKGFDADRWIIKGQLVILSSEGVYNNQGFFDPTGMIAWLQAEAEKALAEGYLGLRVSSEMSWALRGWPGTDRLMEYEARLNDFATSMSCLVVCQYQLPQFEPALLLDVAMAHPVIVYGIEVYDNYYYMRPSAFPVRYLPADRLRQLVKNLGERKDSEEEFRFTRFWVNMASDLVIWINSRGALHYVNEAVCRTLGYSREELLGMMIYQIDLNAPNENWKKWWNEIKQKNSLTTETGLRCKDGRIIPVELKINYLDYNNKGYQCVVGRDISERKQAETIIRTSEEKFRRIIENSQTGYCFIDRDGIYRYVNNAWLAMHGYNSAEEVIGLHYFITQEESSREIVQHNFDRVLSGKAIPSGEGTRRCKDGSIKYQTYSADPVIEDDKIIGFECFLIDITEKKLIEEKFRYLSTHDALTGLYNRAYFEEEMTRLASGRHFPVSIIVADVDSLKWVNDHYGHAVGDELLRRVAEALQAPFRGEDVVARIGGDEFAILLPGVDTAGAEKAIERIRAGLTFPVESDCGPAASLSIGAATGDKGRSLIEVLKQADDRMYREKTGKPKRAENNHDRR